MSVKPDPNVTHAVEFTVVRGESEINHRFTCSGDESALCHQACASCEEACYCSDPVLTRYKGCLIVTWMSESDGPVATYEGEKHAATSGPISVRWDGDDWAWRYADEPAREGASS